MPFLDPDFASQGSTTTSAALLVTNILIETADSVLYAKHKYRTTELVGRLGFGVVSKAAAKLPVCILTFDSLSFADSLCCIATDLTIVF